MLYIIANKIGNKRFVFKFSNCVGSDLVLRIFLNCLYFSCLPRILSIFLKMFQVCLILLPKLVLIYIGDV